MKIVGDIERIQGPSSCMIKNCGRRKVSPNWKSEETWFRMKRNRRKRW